jgi:hypothetical protein
VSGVSAPRPVVPAPGGGNRPLEPVPRGAILIHIGVHKTGTTNLQDRLVANRRQLAAVGIRYPGKGKEHHLQAGSLVGARYSWEAKRTIEEGLAIWDSFAAQMRDESDTVVLSSELFCQADDDQVRRVVDGLGADRIHVLVALRPLGELLPSTWQQHLKSGRTGTYEDWLREMLHRDTTKPVPGFWRRNDVPDLLQRWSSLIGPDRITAVVLDGSDFDIVARTTAELLGVPLDMLSVDTSQIRHNRSMSSAEAEFARRLNVQARERLSGAEYVFWIRAGALRSMVENRRRGPDEPPVGLPEWTIPRLTELGAEHAAALATSGVHMVGDPLVLASAPRTHEVVVPDDIPIDAAVAALLGSIGRVRGTVDLARAKAKRKGKGGKGAGKPRAKANQVVVQVSGQSLKEYRSSELLKVVSRRGRRRVRELFGRGNG